MSQVYYCIMHYSSANISYWGKSPILGFSNAQISLNPKLSSKALSARPVAAAIWPKRWGNDQAAGRRQTRRRGGVTTRGVPRGCVGGQVGARGAGEGVFIITKKTCLGRGEKWNHFVRVFPYLRNFLSSLHLTKIARLCGKNQLS